MMGLFIVVVAGLKPVTTTINSAKQLFYTKIYIMNNFKKAFTLVELVVVITILAILGTIAFVSLR
jgi:prepilin-type N-terminal cleavage/methylation domain-containing protein